MEVGERVTVRGKHGVSKGTVRYLGEINGKGGVWAGIEWDDSDRGTNDGSWQGIQYFTCLRTPPSANFITASKVRCGVDLLDAIQERYTAKQEDLSDMRITTAGHRRMEVTLKGMEKISAALKGLANLKSVTLYEANISRPVWYLLQKVCQYAHVRKNHKPEYMQGDINKLHQVLPNLCELRITNNLLGAWAQIHKVVHNLPSLRMIDVSGNLLQQSEQLTHLPPCLHLQTLVSSDCEISWPDVACICHMFPSLRELYLSRNRITSLTPDVTGKLCFNNIEVLDLMENELESWADVLSLSSLVSLSMLKLSANNISQITPAKGSALSGLKVLLLADNSIADWASIDSLAQFSTITDLRLSRNPVLALSSLSGRNECIARLGHIKRLNGAPISSHERRDCELQYLYHVQQRIADLGSASAAEAALHPRLEELRGIYGDMAVRPSRSNLAKDATLGEQLLDLGLVHLDNGMATGQERTRLPQSTTIVQLKLLCAVLFGLDVNLQQLVLHSGPRYGEAIGNDNSLDLSYWNIQSGDVVGVSEASDPMQVWRQYAGAVDDHVPEHWLLPPELRPDLYEVLQSC